MLNKRNRMLFTTLHHQRGTDFSPFFGVFPDQADTASSDPRPARLFASRVLRAFPSAENFSLGALQRLSALVHKFGNIFSSGCRPHAGGDRLHPIEEL